MNRPRGLLALTVILLIVPAGIPAQEKDDPKKPPAPSKPSADGPATIQGKTIDEWLAALKDRDPAVRKRAVEVAGGTLGGPGRHPARAVEAAHRGGFPGALGKGPGSLAVCRLLHGSLRRLRLSRRGEAPPGGAPSRRRSDADADPPGRRPGPARSGCGREHVFPEERRPRVRVHTSGVDGGGDVRRARGSRAQDRDPGPSGCLGHLRDPAGQGASARRPAPGDAGGGRPADHDRHASGLPGPVPDR